MRVSDIMTKKPARLQQTASVREVIQMMTELDIRHLPILQDKELVGIVSDRDIRSFLGYLDEVAHDPASAKDRLDVAVKEIMRTQPLTLDESDEVSEAVALMIEEKIGALPVVNEHDGHLVGVVSYIDILTALQPLLDD